MKFSKKCVLLTVICVIILSIIYGLYALSVKNTEQEDGEILPEIVIVSDFPHKHLGKFDLSWYSPKELGKSSPEQLRTSTRKIPKSGRTIAVDTSIIPYGSIIYIQGHGYFIAEDCGGAIKGNKIDIFTASYEEAIQKGKQQANVYLLK